MPTAITKMKKMKRKGLVKPSKKVISSLLNNMSINSSCAFIRNSDETSEQQTTTSTSHVTTTCSSSIHASHDQQNSTCTSQTNPITNSLSSTFSHKLSTLAQNSQQARFLTDSLVSSLSELAASGMEADFLSCENVFGLFESFTNVQKNLFLTLNEIEEMRKSDYTNQFEITTFE